MVWPIGVGMLSGYMLTKYTSGKSEGEKGKITSCKFKFKKYKVHVHHWMHQFALIVAISVLQIKETFTLPPWLFHGAIGASAGAIIQGMGYKDWKKIFWVDED